MTEAEILSIRNELTGIVVSVFSVSFGMITAYIAGLWFVLRNAPVTLRSVAFGVLSCGLAFMGALMTGVQDLLNGTEAAWARISAPATGISGFGSERPDWLGGFSLFEATSALGAAAMVTIYLGLFYVTFIYRWQDQT
ncbi:MAG: hypothetical protein ABL894_06485 [Hyphomicrobium sp.]